jgi:hypothetical protein
MSASTPALGRRVTRVMALVLVAQVVIPTWVLIGTGALGWDRPSRGGWQMYSSEGTSRDLLLEFEDGRSRSATLEDFDVRRRDLHADGRTLLRLCDGVEGLDAVTARGDGERAECR